MLKFEKQRLRISEANTTAELYHQLRSKGIRLYLEHKHNKCRFDAILVDYKTAEIKAIIEVKSERNKTNIKANKQFNKYAEFGLPVLLVRGPGDISQAVNSIYELATNDVSLSETTDENTKNIFWFNHKVKSLKTKIKGYYSELEALVLENQK